ncbi:MAG TPA: S8 family serine peptidase, partial [Acidimicrobiales bacterium]
FDHPALHRQYRGARTDGTYDHNYNWFDPTQICPAGTPCDNNGHGTHTMGTMVGDDGTPGENRIGVAPAARWLAAKGCESNNCSDSALLAAAQWMLAPTDLAGQNPRPDLRPQVVNNSWGGTGGDLWFQDIVRSWTASGIFGQFSVGNSGPGCGSAGSPGDYPDAYSTGAFGIDGAIASFSSRGASRLGGGSKPDIAAPGVAVRSSIPGNGYVAFNGTSMAAPHVAGTVALMWSANPLLRGNVAATRYLLDRSAIDVDDTSCGGTPADNNVWGEGKLDALGAVTLAITRGSFGPPHITVTRPAAEGLYKLNEVVPADYSCSDTSDPAPTCSGDVPSGTPLDTSTPGFHFFTITSRNRFGVFSMAQVRYQVLGCNGKAPTIVGGPGDDALTGTAGPDVIVDLGGTDSVRSRGGDDTICLGGGDDTVDAGDGADWIDAGAGANVVDAGNGNNTVTTGSGDDAVVTGSGADTITTGDGDDYIESGSGADRVQAMGGADDIATGDGDDAVDAGDGRDTLNLGGGNDAAATALGPDVVDGGAGSGDSCPPGTTPARAVRCEA